MPATPQSMDVYGSSVPNHSKHNMYVTLASHESYVPISLPDILFAPVPLYRINSLSATQEFSMVSNQPYSSSVKIPSADNSANMGSNRTGRWKESANGGYSIELPSAAHTLKYCHSIRGKEVGDFDDIEVGRLINPFSKQDEEKLLKLRTHNRRRWSHVFPVGM